MRERCHGRSRTKGSKLTSHVEAAAPRKNAPVRNRAAPRAISQLLARQLPTENKYAHSPGSQPGQQYRVEGHEQAQASRRDT